MRREEKVAAFVPWGPECEDPLSGPLGPTRSHAALKRIAASFDLQAVERRICEGDPWHFLANYCVTDDSHWAEKGLAGPYQQFPAKPYVRSLAHVLWAEPYAAFPKSRQMFLTWLCAAYMLGDAIFVPGRLQMIQSKLEEDSVAVLDGRLMGMYDRLRGFARWMVPEATLRAQNHVRFSNGSELRACAQGAHHIQSYTPYRVMFDEVQLQPEAEEAYHQALPAVRSAWLLGSADRGWFYEVFLADKLRG